MSNVLKVEFNPSFLTKENLDNLFAKFGYDLKDKNYNDYLKDRTCDAERMTLIEYMSKNNIDWPFEFIIGHTFDGCDNLRSVIIPANVVNVCKYSFINCKNLTSIKVDKENRVYDSRQDCNAIIKKSKNALVVGCSSTIIPSSITSIGEAAFYGCNIKNIEIPDSVKSISRRAFHSCNSLESIILSKNITEIKEFTFYGCSSLKNIEIPNGVQIIGYKAFGSCTNLESIIIPKSVGIIDETCFEDCPNLIINR